MATATLCSALVQQGVQVGKTIQLASKRTIAGEQSLVVEHCPTDPRYIVTYKTYSSSHDPNGTYRVVQMWKIVLVFSETHGYILETTTYDHETPSLHLTRIKHAMSLGDFGLPRNTTRATAQDLHEVWVDIKTRRRIL